MGAHTWRTLEFTQIPLSHLHKYSAHAQLGTCKPKHGTVSAAELLAPQETYSSFRAAFGSDVLQNAQLCHSLTQAHFTEYVHFYLKNQVSIQFYSVK